MKVVGVSQKEKGGLVLFTHVYVCLTTVVVSAANHHTNTIDTHIARMITKFPLFCRSRLRVTHVDFFVSSASF